MPLVCALVVTGCSDDVVCSEETTPYVSARVEEVGVSRAGSTYVHVYCSHDPLPGMLDVAVSDRELPDPAEAEDALGLFTSLSDTQVIWQPGTDCRLEVATEYGIAEALEPVPGSFVVTAPETVALDETLELTWTESEDADYYVVEAWLTGRRLTPSLERGPELDVAVEGTSVSLDLSELPGAGVLTGRVRAVAGPFPRSGSAGNMTGQGWGYFTVSYRDAGGEFQTVVRDGVVH
ncbi:MAG: hypothetical protein ABIG03_04250 [Candidatus Eisenbacteria bacterium]